MSKETNDYYDRMEEEEYLDMAHDEEVGKLKVKLKLAEDALGKAYEIALALPSLTFAGIILDVLKQLREE